MLWGFVYKLVEFDWFPLSETFCYTDRDWNAQNSAGRHRVVVEREFFGSRLVLEVAAALVAVAISLCGL